jgi:hypothetical protein
VVVHAVVAAQHQRGCEAQKLLDLSGQRAVPVGGIVDG